MVAGSMAGRAGPCRVPSVPSQGQACRSPAAGRGWKRLTFPAALGPMDRGVQEEGTAGRGSQGKVSLHMVLSMQSSGSSPWESWALGEVALASSLPQVGGRTELLQEHNWVHWYVPAFVWL